MERIPPEVDITYIDILYFLRRYGVDDKLVLHAGGNEVKWPVGVSEVMKEGNTAILLLNPHAVRQEVLKRWQPLDTGFGVIEKFESEHKDTTYTPLLIFKSNEEEKTTFTFLDFLNYYFVKKIRLFKSCEFAFSGKTSPCLGFSPRYRTWYSLFPTEGQFKVGKRIHVLPDSPLFAGAEAEGELDLLKSWITSDTILIDSRDRAFRLAKYLVKGYRYGN